ncbi:uncharacterized protein LOC141837707 isoform X2 [Curcuma longa]
MARLVRCPKCQKLLVEYPNVSVYQCGGCGIALRSKDRIAEPSQINQPESHSDRGFSDSESISGPLTSAVQFPNSENKAEDENSSPASNLDDHPHTVKRRSSRADGSSLGRVDVHLEGKEQQVDFVEVVGRVENEVVGSVEDMEERLQYEGIRDVFKSPATRSSLAYYDGSISSSDEARSVRTPERTFGKSRRTVRAASNSDLKLHSGSTSSLPAMTRFNAARGRASSSKGSSFDSDEFQTAESWPALSKGSSFDADEFQSVADLLALPKGSFGGELNEKVAILRKIDEVREQLVKICVPSEGRRGQASRGTVHRLQPQQVRERSQRKQMHLCRPVAGAAPFVICARCTKLLQLPADFLAPTRRSYKLKCAGCDAVLDLPFPAKEESFSEVDPAPTEPDDEPDFCIVSGGGRDVARGKLTTPRLHRLLGYDSASDLLHGDDENDRGHAKMESTGKRGSGSTYHGDFRPGIPRPPVMK